MGEVAPIERPIDKEIKKIKENQERARQVVEDLGKIRKAHLDIITNFRGLSPDEIAMEKSEIAEIDDAIKQAKEAIKIGDMMISEKLERKNRFSRQKVTEIKIK